MPPLTPVMANSALSWGGTRVMENGVLRNVTVTTDVQSGTKGLNGQGWNVRVAVSKDQAGTDRVPLSPEGRLTIRQDRFVNVTGDGFMPNGNVHVYLLSTPTLLGVLQSDAAGRFSGVVRVPDGVSAGNHTLQVNGHTTSLEVRSMSVGVRLVGSTTVTARVRFGATSARLDSAMRARLTRLARQARQSNAMEIVVQVDGFVQGTSVRANEKRLSAARARAVAQALRAAGVKGSYSVSGRGRAVESGPAARRVVVTVTLTK